MIYIGIHTYTRYPDIIWYDYLDVFIYNKIISGTISKEKKRNRKKVLFIRLLRLLMYQKRKNEEKKEREKRIIKFH